VLPLKDNVPTRNFPVVTVALIATNFAVWIFYQLPNLDRSVREYAYQPCEVISSCPPGAAVGHGWLTTAFTSMFLHGGWLHILGNMLFLWIFGNNVEDSMGRIRFLVFYLASGLAADALQTVVTLSMGSTADGAVPNVGASGAISGVLGAYLVLYPNASVLTLVFFFILEIPAYLFLGIWFFFQLWDGGFSLVQPEAGGGTAFFAHIGGFVFGFLAVRLFAKRRPVAPAYR
jgi:membrane associated rhomboid family serine protease